MSYIILYIYNIDLENISQTNCLKKTHLEEST